MNEQQQKDVESCLAYIMMQEFQKDIDAELKTILAGGIHEDTMGELMTKWEDRINFKVIDPSSQTIYLSLKDGSMITMGKKDMGVATAEMVFQGYVQATTGHKYRMIKVDGPDIKAVMDEVKGKIDKLRKH